MEASNLPYIEFKIMKMFREFIERMIKSERT